ncbi:MAG TPA: hypothetical protein VG710_10140 [Opitutus sp.]|nr:hypothetical protein [Opitutus sp.]
MSNISWRRALFVLNFGLAATAVILALRKPEPALAREAGPVKTATEKSPSPELAALHYPDTARVAKQRRWLIDQLRAMGVPNKVLARIVMKDLDRRWSKRAAEISLKTRGDPEVLTALNLEIEKSRDAEMRAALGEEGFKEWDMANMQREINRGQLELAPAESATTYALWKKLQQRDLELKEMKFDGKIDPAGASDQYAKDVAEFQQQMKTLLGDERYAESQAQGPHAVAVNLRHDLANANPTESQFQDLLNAQQQYNDLRSDLAAQSHDDADYAQRLQDLDEARDEEFRRVLGPGVFDSLQKQQDPGYSEMKKYEATWGLDDTKIDHVYSALRYYQKSAEDYQAAARDLAAKGQAVDWDAVNKGLQQFAQQTQQDLQNYLGQGSLDQLQRNGIVQFNQPTGGLPNGNDGRRF